MPRMTFNLQGYMNCGAHEVADLVKAGWRVITDEEFQKELDKKRKSDTIPTTEVETTTVNTSATARTRKIKPSILDDSGEI
jgi:hypothetical protein